MYKNKTMHLEDMLLDIGYASERVTLCDEAQQTRHVAGQNGKTQLIVTVPKIDKSMHDELSKITSIISDMQDEQTECCLIVANDRHQNPNIDEIAFLIDSEGEFGDYYGSRLVGEPLEGELTKSVLLISKDGALFYDEYPKDIETPFNLEMLQVKVAAAQNCYTGKGCH